MSRKCFKPSRSASPGYDLLVHVEKQLAAPVLVDNVERPVERINQMPVPMVQVDADVLAEVADTVLGVQIVGGIVAGYLDRDLPGGRTRMSVLFTRNSNRSRQQPQFATDGNGFFQSVMSPARPVIRQRTCASDDKHTRPFRSNGRPATPYTTFDDSFREFGIHRN